MALIEGCKHSTEITVAVEEVRSETERVVEGIRAEVRLPGFRPGKAPTSLVRQRFASNVREEVVKALVPKAFRRWADGEGLAIVGSPDVTDVRWEEGEPLHFKAEFEVAPEFELGNYRGLEVAYEEPVVAESDVDERLSALRERKADYVNEDPRPLSDGDVAVISLHALSGTEEPLHQDELQIELGGPETLDAFTENLRGMSPGESKEFEIAYPDDYGSEKLAGRTVQFLATVSMVRRKELPELNDEFAQDLGDYKDLGELRDALRRTLFQERQYFAQQRAKDKLVDQLVEAHPFAVPDAYVDQQIRSNVESRLMQMADRGVDPRKVKLDWAKIRESQQERAAREVRGSLLLDKIGNVEAIHATNDEVDREVQRIAKQEREPVAAMRIKLENDGRLRNLANRIRTDKVLNLLFEQARKVAGEAQEA